MRPTRAATVAGLTAATVLAVTAPAAAAGAAVATEPAGRILYTSGLATWEFDDLYSVLPDRTGARTELTDVHSRWPGTSVAYSPDLRTVVYTRSDQSVWTAQADGGNDRPLIASPDLDADPFCDRVCGLDAPRFSPDGSRIASLEPYTGVTFARLVVLDADGTDLKVLPATGDRATMVTQGPVSWSPDGNRVAYAAGPRESDRSAIYVTDVATGATSQLTDAKAFRLNPVWSPDGRRIAFTATVPLPFGEMAYDLDRDLYTITVADRSVRRLTNTPTRVESRPAWALDSAWLAYDRIPLGNQEVRPAVRLIGANGTGDRPLDVNGRTFGWLR